MSQIICKEWRAEVKQHTYATFTICHLFLTLFMRALFSFRGIVLQRETRG